MGGQLHGVDVEDAVRCAAFGQSPLIAKMLCISSAASWLRILSIDVRS
jgi:hypothetical protein